MDPCIPRGDSDEYQHARQIGNARFNLFPDRICYCETIDDVKHLLKEAREKKLPIRVRAGGHQHEGMCSGDGVTIIDVSKMNGIRIYNRGQKVWVGPGAKNEDLYQKLWTAEKRQVFSGGGCGDVRVGGFVQGAGWGPYSRGLGMACDRLLSFHIVLANGDDFDVTDGPKDPRRDLFWAVCGGGGGNFGVVTEYVLKTARIGPALSQFTITWSKESDRRDVIEDWRTKFPADSDHQLTSFCRVTASANNNIDPPIMIGGFCIAGHDATESMLMRMLPKTFDRRSGLDIKPVHNAPTAAFAHEDYQPGPPLSAEPGCIVDLTTTCAGKPYPHKVSSCFPHASFDKTSVDRIVDFSTSRNRRRTRGAISACIAWEA